jgi:hypothetical protein
LEVELLGVSGEEMEYNHSHVNLEWRRSIWNFCAKVPQRMNYVVGLERAPSID